MRIACIYWDMKSVGGIATHLNTLRKAAIRAGDSFDILRSFNWRKKTPKVFPERKRVFGGDTTIWIDGEIPQTAEARVWLEKNYDAVLYGPICPRKNKLYPNPDFTVLYDVQLPKAAWVFDGHWDDYGDWAKPLCPAINAVLCPLESYAAPVRRDGVNVIISPFPFLPQQGKAEPRTTKPSLVWPNQWKDIKGVKPFLEQVPAILREGVSVDLYSTGVRYFQLRHERVWSRAIEFDHITGTQYEGGATYYGNVEHDHMMRVFQQSWMSCNLQGLINSGEAYKQGSYNNTEVEALWYGCCPILHESAARVLPPSIFIPVPSADSLPVVCNELVRCGWAIDPVRQRRAREFVGDVHLASKRYQDARNILI